METKIIEIDASDLQIGMYVSKLDRPWLETPFLFQGFRICSEDEIGQLKQLCRTVSVDLMLGDAPLERRGKLRLPSSAAEAIQSMFRPNVRRRPTTPPAHPVDAEIPQARAAHDNLVEVMRDTVQALKSGGALRLDAVRDAAVPIVASIERNADALAWLASMRRKGDELFHHSVGCAVLVAMVGRHLTLSRTALEQLTIGGLLFDVGKTQLPDDVLLKPDRLTEEEFVVFKSHVDVGVRTLEGCTGISPLVLAMARTHHERHDGSGYQDGLKGAEIPAFGKIAGIVDTYHAMLFPRPNVKAFSVHDVLNFLYRRREREFDAALVEEFIQAIGAYPTGSLVSLDTGQIAVVIEQNAARRLQPKVMIVADSNRQRLRRFETVDLLIHNSSAHLEPIQIVESLEPGSIELDPDELFL